MALLSDTLETLFVLRGVEELITGLGRSAAGFATMAAGEAQATAGAAALDTALSPLIGTFELVAAGIGILTLGIGHAADEFRKDEQNIFRTSLALRNMGSSIPIARLQEFSQEMQKTVAVDDAAVVGLAGLLKEFNVADGQVEPAIKAIVDYSKATGQDIPSAGQSFTRALLGQSRALKAIGVDFHATGDRASDLQRLIGRVEERTRGAAEAQRHTLGGSFEALQESASNFFSSLGQLFAPQLVAILDSLTAFFNKLTELIQGIIAYRDRLTGQVSDGSQFLNGVSNIPAKGDPQQTAYLQTIANHTGDLVKSTLFGSGVQARKALTARDLKLAFGT